MGSSSLEQTRWIGFAQLMHQITLALLAPCIHPLHTLPALCWIKRSVAYKDILRAVIASYSLNYYIRLRNGILHENPTIFLFLLKIYVCVFCVVHNTSMFSTKVHM